MSRPHDAEAGELLSLAYDELKALAARYLEGERVDHTLQPTALVHEAYVRLEGSSAKWTSRAHFFAVAARAMRNILVDHARRRAAQRRGAGATHVSLGSIEVPDVQREMQVLELDDLLNRLAELDARRAKVVEMKFFAGMTNEQIAEVLDVARSTVADDWTVARAWLAAELADDRQPRSRDGATLGREESSSES
jgi:RNA polymerase sigma factor (TIGR02999 family)